MNFEKDLRKYTNEELYKNLDNHDPRFGSLSSDELTRRSMKELKDSIGKLNASTEFYSKRLLILTLVLFVFAVLQTVIGLGIFDNYSPIISTIFIFFIALWILFSAKKELYKKDKNS